MKPPVHIPFLHRQLQMLAHWLFTVYHDIQVEGAEHIPADGAAIIASNHPTYLDGAFLMVGLKRPIRFMAWEKPFRVPFLGMLMRHYGSVPVDMKKPGRASFEAAVKILKGGAVFGIFPEGGRTKGLTPMNPLKSGVARLALITGAPIIPATILGGRQVWRRGNLLPKPGPIRVVFHPPIRVAAEDRALWRRDKNLEKKLIESLISTIHGTLIPAMRKEERIERILERSPQTPSLEVEGIPFLFLLAAWILLPAEGWSEYGQPGSYWIGSYLLLLGIETLLEVRGWAAKWMRHLLPWATLAGIIHHTLGHPVIDDIPYLIAEAGFAAFLIWCTIFRFQIYRRLRTMMLLTAYGTWLLYILSWAVSA